MSHTHVGKGPKKIMTEIMVEKKKMGEPIAPVKDKRKKTDVLVAPESKKKSETVVEEPVASTIPCNYTAVPKMSVVHFSVFYDHENNAWASSLPNFISGYASPH